MGFGGMLRAGRAAALMLALAGCAGDQSVILPPQQGASDDPAPRTPALQRAADGEHQRLLAAFGGEYRSSALRAALGEIVQRLAKAGEGQIGIYEITILNSPAVNAFALPTGRLYVTRGLLALANDTAEIASVMAHEIAHVTARHAVERAEREAETALVGQVVSQVLNDPAAGATLQTSSKLSLARFSRQQELAADQISVRNIARAGYDPYGAVRFLVTLGRNTAFRNSQQGQSAGERRLDILSSHPSTPERIAAVTSAARQIAAPGIGETDSGRWLGLLAGLAFGDDPTDGVVRGRRYLNSALRIAFEAPAGFNLEAARDMVVGVSDNGLQALRFDAVVLKPDQTLESYVSSGWIEGVATGPVETREIGGLKAALTAGKGTDWRFSLAAVEAGGKIYRFILASRGGDPQPQLEASLAGFRVLSAADAQMLKPLQIRLVAAQPGDTAAGLAERMASLDRAQEQFLILNGLERGKPLETGRRYKIVAE